MTFKGNLTLIDFEATERDPLLARATEIGLIALDDDLNEVARYSTVIQPPVKMHSKAQEISKISDADIARAHPFEDYWPDIHPFLDERILVAHNAKYDMGVLASEFRAMSLDYQIPALCTYEMSQRTLKGITKNLQLGTICAHFGIEFNAHQALDDALAAGSILRKMLEMRPSEKELIDYLDNNRVSIPAPIGRAMSATPRDLDNPFVPIPIPINVVNVGPRSLSDSEVIAAATRIRNTGRKQVCLTGEPSMGKEVFSSELLQVGFEYAIGPIRKTMTAFLVIGTSEIGQSKINDARQHEIPIFSNADFLFFLENF